MKKVKGFIDPVSLSLILVFGIGLTGVTTDIKTVDEEKIAQTSRGEEQAAPAMEESRTLVYN